MQDLIPETRTDQSGLSEAADEPQRSSKGGGGFGWGAAQQGHKWRLIVSTFKETVTKNSLEIF